MSSTRRVALLLIASLILTSSPVYAGGGGGGGGTKRSSKIVFVNYSSEGIAVTTDTTNTAISEVLTESPVQVSDWTRAGGKFASTGGGKATFTVSAGTYSNIGVTDQSFAALPMTAPGSAVVVGKGQTIYIVVTDGDGGAGTFTLTVQTTAPTAPPVTAT